jgi:hypothetical protein
MATIAHPAATVTASPQALDGFRIGHSTSLWILS